MGDAFAMILQGKKQDSRATDFVMEDFATIEKNAMRSFHYSTNLKTTGLGATT
jgi:hypothetical protein